MRDLQCSWGKAGMKPPFAVFILLGRTLNHLRGLARGARREPAGSGVLRELSVLSLSAEKVKSWIWMGPWRWKMPREAPGSWDGPSGGEQWGQRRCCGGFGVSPGVHGELPKGFQAWEFPSCLSQAVAVPRVLCLEQILELGRAGSPFSLWSLAWWPGLFLMDQWAAPRGKPTLGRSHPCPLDAAAPAGCRDRDQHLPTTKRERGGFCGSFLVEKTWISPPPCGTELAFTSLRSTSSSSTGGICSSRCNPS